MIKTPGDDVRFREVDVAIAIGVRRRHPEDTHLFAVQMQLHRVRERQNW